MTPAAGLSETERFPGWEADEFGTLTLSVVVAGEKIRLATVICDSEMGLYETFIGLPFGRNQLGRHDSNQERAVRKAEDFVTQKLRKLL
jgi:hypothetical protein